MSNDLTEAEKSRLAIEETLKRYNTGDQYKVVLVHNPKGLYGKYELLQLKTFEENYFESLQKLACRFDSVCTIDYKVALKVCDGFLSLAEGNVNSATTTKGGIEKVDERMLPMKDAVLLLIQGLQRHNQAVIIAYSEANLLVGPALACYVVSEGKEMDSLKNIRVINVANTSSISHSGLDLTHDADTALAFFDKLPAIFMGRKRTTGQCDNKVCDFARANPTLKIINRPSAADQSNQLSLAQTTKGIEHNFVGTYLSEKQEVQVIEGELSGVQFEHQNGMTFAERFRTVVRAAVQSLPKKAVPSSVHQTVSRIGDEMRAKATLACYERAFRGARQAKPSDYGAYTEETIARKQAGYINDDMFFVLGDFNHDQHIDVAAVLVEAEGVRNTHELGWNSGIVIFNGPLTGECMASSFYEMNLGAVGGVTLFLDDRGLKVGKWESSVNGIVPDGDTYRLE